MNEIVEDKTLEVKSHDDKILINYSLEMNGSKMDFNSKIEKSDFIVIQKLFEFSLPYINGYHSLISNKFVEEDIENNNL